MVAHRKNVPPGKAYVPSTWFIVLTVMVLVGGAGWLGWLVIDDDSTSVDVAAPAATTPAATPEPTEPSGSAGSADETPEPDETPTPSEDTPDEPAGERSATVSVLNNSGVAGAARAFSAKVTTAGWTLGGVGNWTGSIGANTVYYPAGLESQAQQLAEDVGIDRVRPRVAPMRPDRLTIILSGPQ